MNPNKRSRRKLGKMNFPEIPGFGRDLKNYLATKFTLSNRSRRFVECVLVQPGM
jgi:hypothetical protein